MLKTVMTAALLTAALAGCGVAPDAPLTAQTAATSQQQDLAVPLPYASFVAMSRAISGRLDRNIPDDVVRVQVASIEPTAMIGVYQFQGTETVTGIAGVQSFQVQGLYNTQTTVATVTHATAIRG